MKICPRCSLVDDAHRRVCVGCRRSLMAAPDLERDEVLEQRALALAGHRAGAVPWGPALEVREPAVAAAVTRSSASVAGTDDDEHDGGGIALATLAPFVVPDRVPDDLAEGTVDAVAGEPPDDDNTEARAGVADAPADEDDDAESEADPDVARATRDRLVKMYDPRANAAVVMDAVTPRAPRRSRTEQADEPVDPARRRTRRRVLAIVVVAALALVGLRTTNDALHRKADARTDPTIRVEKLPWHDVSFGDVVAQLPGTSEVATFGDDAGGEFAHRRYELPDISITVIDTTVPSVPANDIAMRGIADRLMTSVGGRLDRGSVVDTGWGAAYSAHGTTPDGESLIYVVRTNGALVEVRGDTVGAPGERALRIFERVVRSFQPA